MRVTVATEPGDPTRSNEDSVASMPAIVAVADGSTARTETGCSHGVAWYAQRLTSTIAHGSPTAPASNLAAAIALVAKEHEATCDLDHPGTPSAAVGIVSIAGNTLHYLVLADVAVVIDTVDGLRVISDDRVSRVALHERREADRWAMGSPEKAAALVRMKHAEHAVRNRPGGFWVAAADPLAAHEALVGEIPLDRVRRLGVFTDGATRGVEEYGLHRWTDLIAMSPDEVIRQVRAVEHDDLECRKWPRNKVSDDATAVLIEL